MGVLVLLGCCTAALASTDDPGAPPPPPPSPVSPAPAAAPEAKPHIVTPAEPQSAPPAEPAEASEVVVYMKDGQRFTGLLVSSDQTNLKVRVAGIVATFPLEMVQKYEVLPPVLQRYMELRSAVGDDPAQIVRLADWLRERERYTLALAETERALKIDPQFKPAKDMKVLLEQQLLLKVKAAEDPAGGGGEGDEEGGVKGRSLADRIEAFPLLSRDQINLLKVYELDLDTRPRLVIKRETVTRLLEQHSGHPLVPITREGRESWYRKDPVDLMQLMFRLQARTLYDQVQVLDQPRTFELFRDQVQRTWLLPRCATNECHGGAEAGRFVLYNRKPNSEQTVYTNFLIVSRYRLPDGRPLLDIDDPAKSPLLQLGLPREDSLYPHPAVMSDRSRGGASRDIYRHVFNAREDRMFQEGVEWVRTLFRPRPEYPIEYRPYEGRSPGGAGVGTGEAESGGASGKGSESGGKSSPSAEPPPR